MKYLLYILFLLVSFALPQNGSAQIITTVAGKGVVGDSGDGLPATSAQISVTGGIHLDSQGNLYISEFSNKIRKVSSSGIISTIAGNGIAGYNGDNQSATAAQLNQPSFITTDKHGNVFISDCYNNRVRKIDVFGIITTIAGNGTGGFAGDGYPATTAELYSPFGLCFDTSGNLYIADHANLRIRKVDTSGIISTVAGNGSTGFTGDGGSATDAGIGGVMGICIDGKENLYMADNYGKVRKISLSSGIIVTIAGTNTPGYSGDGLSATIAQLSGPFDVAIDSHENIYISDNSNYRIRIVNYIGFIYTIAGNSMSGYNGDLQPSTSATVSSPRGIAIDSCGNLYIADNGNYRIRKVTYPYCNYVALKNEAVSNKELFMYPNPTSDFVHIDNVKTNAAYRLYNVVGSTVQQVTLKAGDNTLSVQSLPEGMYLLEIIDDEGRRTVSKVVKQ